MNDFDLIFKSEMVGVWVIQPETDELPTIIVKAPGTSIKALRRGCKTDLYFGISGSFGGLALMVYDTEDNPLLIPMVARTLAEVEGFVSLLHHSEFYISVYDEFDALTMTGKANLSTKSPDWPWSEDVRDLKVPDSKQDIESTLSSICFAINPHYGTQSFGNTRLVKFSAELSLNPLFVMSAHESGIYEYDVDDLNEGSTQEQHLHQQLQLHFGSCVFLSPQIQVGKKQRELIDVLVKTNDASLLFESKALCINDSVDTMGYSKYAGKVIGHCKKALRQIEGASKKYKGNHEIFDSRGELIDRGNINNIFGVIVISEFYPHSDWTKVLEELLRVSSKNKVGIVIIDLVELVKTMKISRFKGVSLPELLAQRYIASKRHKTLHIVGTDSSLPCFNNT